MAEAESAAEEKNQGQASEAGSASHGGGGGGHGGHGHEEQGFVAKYLWSTDHKMIAMQYLFTGMFMALIGTNYRINHP